MPLAKPHKGESKEEFVARCASDETMLSEFPDNDQRLAVCNQQWSARAASDHGIERRAYPAADIQVEDAGEARTLVGHAAVFDLLSEEMYGIREKIQAGAFAETINSADIAALFNHDPNLILGRTTATPPTLRLREDEQGLAVEIDLPDTQLGRDLRESVGRGDISGMSFTFKAIDQSWDRGNGVDIRTLERVKLFDVSPVTYPAYPDTDVAVRSHQAWQAERRRLAPRPRLKRVKRGMRFDEIRRQVQETE